MVRWEEGADMLTPAGTVEIHSDEGDVIGYVYPKYVAAVISQPDLLAALDMVATAFAAAARTREQKDAILIAATVIARTRGEEALRG